jgi:hypothetical protein
MKSTPIINEYPDPPVEVRDHGKIASRSVEALPIMKRI